MANGDEKLKLLIDAPATEISSDVRKLCAARLLSLVGSRPQQPKSDSSGSDGAGEQQHVKPDALESVIAFLEAADNKGVPSWCPEETEEEEGPWGKGSGLLRRILEEVEKLSEVMRGGKLQGFALSQARGIQHVLRHGHLSSLLASPRRACLVG